jgi:hypothetical protein
VLGFELPDKIQPTVKPLTMALPARRTPMSFLRRLVEDDATRPKPRKPPNVAIVAHHSTVRSVVPDGGDVQ